MKKEKILKLNKNEMFLMIFQSGYHNYVSIGNDLEIMASNILESFNSYCYDTFTIEDLAKDEDCEYRCLVYKVDMNVAFNDENFDFVNGNLKTRDYTCVGDYFNKYRDKSKKLPVYSSSKNEKHLWED